MFFSERLLKAGSFGSVGTMSFLALSFGILALPYDLLAPGDDGLQPVLDVLGRGEMSVQDRVHVAVLPPAPLGDPPHRYLMLLVQETVRTLDPPLGRVLLRPPVQFVHT